MKTVTTLKHNASKVEDLSGNNILKDKLFKIFIMTTSVFISEILVGIFYNSLAIISDALHASIDLVTALLLLITDRVAIRPPDENHTYGHGKVDTIGGFLGSIMLFFMALYILYEAVTRWAEGRYTLSIGPISYVVLCYVLLIEILKAHILSREHDKDVVKVGLIHNLADTGGTIVAIFSSFMVNAGFPQADLLASIALSVFIIFASVKMLRSFSLELSDAISKRELVELKTLLSQIVGHKGFKDLRMRKVGNTCYIEVTILVSPDIKIEDAHDVSEKVENLVSNKFGAPSVCTIHMEPSSDDNATVKYIKEEVNNIRGLRSIHSVKFGIIGGVVHITLHANVDGNVTLEEAHQIADEIERRLSRKFESSRIFVHLEPVKEASTNTNTLKIDLDDLNKSIVNIGGVEEVSAIDLYELKGKKHFEICVKTYGGMSLESAHRIASKVETLVKSKIDTGVSVEVHVEPV